MSRIDDVFEQCRGGGRAALCPFVTGGYPTLEVTEAVLPALSRAGADIIEVGIPFSDPIADGPVIAASMHEALSAGVTPRKVFEVIRKVRGDVDAGLVAMVSYSIVGRDDPGQWVKQAADAGVDGIIVPDIDVDAADDLRRVCGAAGMSMTLLIAPTTEPGRVEQIARKCSGFVYVLARVGITGERAAGPDSVALAERLAVIRKYTDLPLAVGFGISSAEQVAAVSEHADGVIVGSALVRRMSEAGERGGDPAAAAADFVGELSRGIRSTVQRG